MIFHTGGDNRVRSVNIVVLKWDEGLVLLKK